MSFSGIHDRGPRLRHSPSRRIRIWYNCGTWADGTRDMTWVIKLFVLLPCNHSCHDVLYEHLCLSATCLDSKSWATCMNIFPVWRFINVLSTVATILISQSLYEGNTAELIKCFVWLIFKNMSSPLELGTTWSLLFEETRQNYPSWVGLKSDGGRPSFMFGDTRWKIWARCLIICFSIERLIIFY